MKKCVDKGYGLSGYINHSCKYDYERQKFMKRIYGVTCLYISGGDIHVANLETVADNEGEAKNYALQTMKKANGITDAQCPSANVVQDNGPASQADINSFNLFCKKYNIK